MAYTRWSSSDWYIYWDYSDRLAVWHKASDNDLFLNYDDCKYILETGDLKEIIESVEVGKFSEKELLLNCIRQFVDDLEEELKERQSNEGENFSSLESIRDLDEGWDGYQAEKISPTAIDNCKFFVNAVMSNEMIMPIVSPVSSGSVALIWQGSGVYIEVEFSDTCSYFVSEEWHTSGGDFLLSKSENIVSWIKAILIRKGN